MKLKRIRAYHRKKIKDGWDQVQVGWTSNKYDGGTGLDGGDYALMEGSPPPTAENPDEISFKYFPAFYHKF